MFNIVLANVDYFKDIFYRNQAEFCFSLGDKNVQGRRKIVGERDFSLQSSYTDQIQCLSHSRDQKFVTSLVQNAITRDF